MDITPGGNPVCATCDRLSLSICWCDMNDMAERIAEVLKEHG